MVTDFLKNYSLLQDRTLQGTEVILEHHANKVGTSLLAIVFLYIKQVSYSYYNIHTVYIIEHTHNTLHAGPYLPL